MSDDIQVTWQEDKPLRPAVMEWRVRRGGHGFIATLYIDGVTNGREVESDELWRVWAFLSEEGFTLADDDGQVETWRAAA